MTIIILIFCAFLLVTSRYTKKNENYLDKDYTNIIKGFFLLFVFIGHFVQYKTPFSDTWVDTIGLTIKNKLSQLVVVMFLFYSGYGIMESAKKKGKNYIDNIPKKRILPTWVNFAIAVIIYMICTQYFVTHKFSIKKLVLSLIGLDGFGNSNWYIFCILILYFITYLSLKSFSLKDKKKILASMFVGTLLYTVLMSFYRDGYWYNTAFCFVLGSAYSLYKEQIESWIENRELISLIYLVAIFIIAYNLRKNIFWYHIHTLVFVLIIVILTRKVKIKNVVLAWIGKNLFPMYIFQRLPMIFLNKIEYMHNNPYIFFVTAFALTILITIVYNAIMFIINKLKDKLIRRPIKET